MTPRYPSLAVLGLAGALLLPALARANEPAPTEEVSVASKTLDELEAQAPKEWRDPAAIAASHTRAIALVDSNVLQTGDDFYRAAQLFRFHLGENRLVRVRYELLLAAAAKGHAQAERELSDAWDGMMMQSGRPARFVERAGVGADIVELDPAPACIKAVWRNPSSARAAAADVADNLELKQITDADQADRRNWANRAPEEAKAGYERDRARNARVRAMIAAGEVRTASDFAHAALILQHSPDFPGHRLAHEVAVASLLLGDRRLGRWLAAASYDRMLRSAGIDQRFGTQMTPQGPVYVNESAICDNQRTALGCPTLADARARAVPKR